MGLSLKFKIDGDTLTMSVLPLEASAEQNESTRNEINDEMEMDHVIESTNTITEDQSQDSAIVPITNPQSVTDVQSSGSADVAFENIPEGEQIMPKKKGKRRHYKASEKLKILKYGTQKQDQRKYVPLTEMTGILFVNGSASRVK